MARIYKGVHTELERYVAVKVINWGLQEDAEFTDRFRREAQTIALLRHPNIVQLLDFGKHGSGYFMVMEFIDGSDLAVQLGQYRKEQKLLPKDNVIKIIKDVAAALDYAHNREVIHRDVKPSNLMINEEGQAILTDFGLVMLPAHQSQATLGSTFGTPHYIAPEQAISSAAAVKASDIYSLGIILYEMTTGQVPFDDESALSVALKHISDLPIPPTALNPDLPREVEDVILRALAKEPVDRFATAGDMALALEAAWQSEPVFESGPGNVPGPVLPAGAPPVAEVPDMTLPNAAAVAPVASVDGASATLPSKEKARPQPAEKSLLSNWWFIALVGVIGILVGALTLFSFNNFKATPTLTPSAEQIALVKEPTPTPTPTFTSTPSPEPTNTLLPPTKTPTPRPTATPSASPSPTNTVTATPTLTPTSTPTPTATPTSTATNTPVPLPQPTATPVGLDGKILFKTDRAGFVQIYSMNPDGSDQRPIDDWSIYTQLEAEFPFSPDKKNQILVRGEGQLDLWWINFDTGQELRVTSTSRAEYDPVWSPVDNRIAYVSEETGRGDIYVLNLDGSAVERLTNNVEDFDKHPTWSPDGTKIAFWSDMSFNNNRQIWLVNLKTKTLTSLSDNPFNDWDPVWAP
jgi:serine/threonine-protein kinase